MVLDAHHVTQLLDSPKRVIDVGVGDGRMARYLKEAGHIVHCVDVVAEAFENCKPHCDVFSDVEALHELHPMPSHLAVCHLVAQLCPDEMIVDMIQGVARHLNDDGVLSLQYASPYKHDEPISAGADQTPGGRLTIENMDKGLLKLRWPWEIEKLAWDAECHVAHYVHHQHFPSEGGIRWHICHIKKGRKGSPGTLTDLYKNSRPRLSVLVATGFGAVPGGV